MRDVFKHSKIIEQELTKDDFSTLARIVNSMDIENTVPIDDSAGNWIHDLQHVEDMIKKDHVRAAENTIVFLATPLLISMTDKIVRKTFLDERNDIFNPVFYAGIVGMKKGIKKYDDSKDGGKSVHYIARWFNVYAGRELARSEADALGVPYTRYKMLKKISAVRIKISEQLNRAPSNIEIVEYFHSGRAEVSTFGSAKSDTKKVSKSNSSITINDVIEQERVYESYFLSSSYVSNIVAD